MKKYTEQAKLSAVEDYCSGSAGHREVAHRHGVNASSLRKWIAAYQALGAAGLKSKRKKNHCPEFKLNVLQRMREEELSYRQVAALFDIRKSDIIGEWERRYDEGGLEALSRQPGSGRHKKMTNPIQSTALLHHITPQLLAQSFYALRRDAAVGVDGMSWREYEEGLLLRVPEAGAVCGSSARTDLCGGGR